MDLVIAVDTGGTFTDAVVVDASGGLTAAKASSTPHDFSEGTINAVARAAAQMGLSLEELLARARVFAHGTTVATNAYITRTGSRVGLITTKGAEDVLLIGRAFQKVAGLTDSEMRNIARLDKPDPLVPRPLIKGVTERVDAKGVVVVPLNREEAQRAIEELARAGVEAIAVCLLWSFKNPSHEKQIKELIQRMYPEMVVTISSELTPTIREYQRAATTTINAYLTHKTSRYLESLEGKLRQRGLAATPLVMQSMGGVIPFGEAKERSVALLSSGPSGGVIASLAMGESLGHKEIIVTDVGGTSFDVSLIVGGSPKYAREPVVGRYHLSLPMIEIKSIGAGGGSIAWLESGSKLLKVGPQSAGARPGPVCYDLGGGEPTVTDANVVLGRIDPDYFLGGAIRLNQERAAQAIEERIAGPLGIGVPEAAAGIIDIIDAKMADLVRNLTVARGYDPKEFAIYAFGGAGPAHVGAYGRDVGARMAVVPSTAAVFSALGIASSDFVRIREVSYPLTLPGDLAVMNEIFAAVERQVIAELEADGLGREQILVERTMDLRYRGQIHDIRTPVPEGAIDLQTLTTVLQSFEAIYEQTYGEGTAFREAAVEAVVFRATGRGLLAKPPVKRFAAAGGEPGGALKGRRPVYWRELGGFSPTEVFEMARLGVGHRVEGPAIIEEVDTTVVIHPGQKARVDEFRNFILEL